MQVGKHINDTILAHASQYCSLPGTAPTAPAASPGARGRNKSPTKGTDSAAATEEKATKSTSKGSPLKGIPADKDAEEGEAEEVTEGQGAPTNQQEKQPKCKGCGKRHPPGCFLGPDKANHPDWNKTELEWAASPNGIAWQKHKKHFLPSNKSLTDPNWTNPNMASQKRGGVDGHEQEALFLEEPWQPRKRQGFQEEEM